MYESVLFSNWRLGVAGGMGDGVPRPDGVNVARFKTVTATSFFSGNHVPSKAVDGSGNFDVKCFRSGTQV